MKAWILLIVVAVAFTITTSVALPLMSGGSSKNAPGPKLVAPPVEISPDAPEVDVTSPLSHDFGVMAQETNGTHGWVFKNMGKGTLELRNLGTDCSCTIAQIGKETADSSAANTMLPVAPGKEERVELTWNTRQINGGYHKSAKIGTNDPRKPLVTLSVEGKVYPAVQVYPDNSAVNFMTVSNDEDVHRIALIYSKDRPEMKITHLQSSSPQKLEVHSRPMNEDECKALKVQAGLAIDMTLKANGDLGSFDHEVLVQVDHPDKPVVRLQAMGRITGPVSFSPDRARITGATSSGGGSTSQIVWVRGRSNTKIEVEKAPPGIDVKFTPMTQPDNVKGTKYLMTVSIAPGTEPQTITGELVLKTDHPQAAQIRVPVDAVVLGNQ